MGNNTWVNFVFRNDEGIQTLEKTMMENFLKAVAGDVCSKEKLAEITQNMVTSAIGRDRYGRVEIPVNNLYWFGVTAYAEKLVNFSLLVEDFYMLNEPAMLDFSRRVHSAFKLMKPWYGYAETDESSDKLWEKYKVKFKPDAHVCWINYYSPGLADELGRDRILSASKATSNELGDITIDELSGGAIILQVGKMPGYVQNIPKTRAIETALFGGPCKYDAKKV